MEKYKVLYFNKIPSTQNYALDMIANGDAANRTAVVAQSQTAGRGRYRRRWVSRPGNLYVSFIYDCAVRDARISYAVAVAVAETVASFDAPARIKWPNDVLVDDKKISGVLIEYSDRFVVVGIGINIAYSPAVDEYETARLADWADVSASRVLGRLMQNMDTWMAADFADVRARWTQMAARINEEVLYRGMPAILIGINEDGAMILRRDGKNFCAYGDEVKF